MATQSSILAWRISWIEVQWVIVLGVAKSQDTTEHARTQRII